MKSDEIRAQLGPSRLARLRAAAELLEISEQEVLRRLIDLGMPSILPQAVPSQAVEPAVTAEQLPADRRQGALESPPDRRQIAARSPSEGGTIKGESFLFSGEGDLLGGGEEEPRKTRKAKKEPEEYPADFLEFWEAYPRKVDKAHALKAWLGAAKAGRLPALAEILSALSQQTRGWTDPNYIPHAATWINRERWGDLVAAPVTPAPARASPNPAPSPGTDPRATMLVRGRWMTIEQYKALED